MEPIEKVVIPGREPVKHKPTLRERIDDVIYAELGGLTESLTPETRLVADLGADSLNLTEMAIALEEEFEIPEVDDRRVDKFVSVEDVYKYVEKALGVK